ncbi:adenylate cyclase [[Leptolyngbya] sp. PCC 7376]|nr:adenylate cyclase [[Leptolyngbya] sp. PCC 7376]
MMHEHFTELLRDIYDRGHMDQSQAKELRRLFLEMSSYNATHIARLRLENDIAQGIITNSGPFCLL